MQAQLLKSLELLHLAEKLKTEMRHSWLSNERQESVAEHSWRMSLMVILFAPYLDKPVDMVKSLKMAIVHDLVEAEAGDVPVFEVSERKANKYQNECQAIENIKNNLNSPVGIEIYSLWYEYEAKESYEARFINALDKLEVVIQHNEADIATWLPWELNYQCQGVYEHCKFDSTLTLLSKLVQDESHQKIINAGHELDALLSKNRAGSELPTDQNNA